MDIHMNIKFDDDEKLVLQKIPKDAVDSFVKLASEKALNSISTELAVFINAVELYGYVGNKEGDFS